MNYEQKYNEALNDMRAIYPNLKGEAKLAMEHAFPELAESEEERIRKEMISFLKSEKAFQFIDIDKSEKWIAYLEKQKEQKPVVVVPKYRVGDIVLSTKNPRLTYKILEIGHINELNYPEYKLDIKQQI